MNSRKGIVAAFLSYFAWGVMPVYWKALTGVPATQILSHRIVWAFVFNIVVLTVLKRWSWVRSVVADRRLLLLLTASAVSLSLNWLIYIWAVNSGHLLESSLGYFMNPLVNVALGVLVFKERLRPGQWAAIAIAAAGVMYLTISSGAPPWVALALAASFGAYGALRKVARLDSLEGLTAETAVIAPFAAAWLFYSGATGSGAFGAAPGQTILLIAAGALTAIPLLLFSVGVRSLPMSTLGILQYVSPTLQFLLGALLYHEPFDSARAVGFVAVWIALAVYSGEGIWQRVIVADSDSG
jgi:chloramphenicol-sensitive protein RarD